LPIALAVLTLALPGLIFSAEFAHASPDWLSGWAYRRAIDLSPATATADYQIPVTLTTATMGNPYVNVQADGSDIRFTAPDETTLLDYWVESWDNTGTSQIWVEVATPGTSTIYVYYGNTAASSASDGDATFVFFDDFSDGTLDKWKYLTGASVVTDATQPSQFGTYAMNLDAGTNYVKCNTAPMQDAGIRVLMKDPGTGGSGSPDADGVVGLRGSDSNSYDGILVEHDTDTGFHFDIGAAGSVPGDYITFDVWEWQEFVAYGTIPADHQAKHWEYGTAEPATYSLQATSVTATATGLPFVRVASGEACISVVTVRKYLPPEPTATVGSEEHNSAPDLPSGLNPTNFTDGSWVDDDTPTLNFTQSDPDSDNVGYTIQIDDDNNFSSPAVDYTSELLAEGDASFTVGQAEGGGSYTAGDEGQTLNDNAYFWRVMSTDENGVAGGWSVANGGDIAFRLNTAAESGGTSKDRYRTNENVEVSGSGFPINSDVDVYVVADGEWLGGEAIADYGIVVMETFSTDDAGNFGPEVIWHAPLDIGEYDVVFDADGNGDYDEIPDFVDNPNHPGFTVVPAKVGGAVYPVDKTTLLLPWLGLVVILTLAGAYLARSRAENQL
jgi:hypothetical protein